MRHNCTKSDYLKAQIFPIPSEARQINVYRKQFAGKEFSSFKTDLADVIVDKIIPIGKEMQKLIDDKPYLDGIMKKGKEKAIYVADSVLNKVYDVVGFSKT